jgi:pyruvate dehydrogenase E2 component (dihydrolipoamide acetyltransferase)
MAEVVTMPRLSDTMTDGVVAQWHKKVGDKVSEGDLLAEIETDKATMEFESFQEGTLLYIGVEEGVSAPVDSILAILGEKGEDIQSLLKAGSNPSSTEQKAVNEKEEELVVSKEPSKDLMEFETNSSEISDRVKISPLAKRIAEDKGLDLKSIQGSGDGGRIVRRDVEGLDATPTNLESANHQATAGIESYTEQNVSQMRKVIARRLSESKFSAPHFYLTIDIDMDKVWSERKTLAEATGTKVSFNDFVVKSCAMALRNHPYVNGSWLGDKLRFNNHIHIGVAVSVEEGLLVPVIRFADQKGLSAISSEVRDMAEKAKSKKLQPKDWEGNTFTISNLGMFGIEDFTAIINPPDSCILAVGAIRDEAVVKNGQVVPGKRMKVTLSCDHRIVDGVAGAQFLQEVKRNLENPLCMLL